MSPEEHPNLTGTMTKLMIVKCPDCKREFNIPLIKHHIINKNLKKYLINVGNYPKKDIEKLRRMLFVYICKECENKFHNSTVNFIT